MNARVLIFWEPDFPFADTAAIELQQVIEALPPMESVRSVGVEDLRKRLKRNSTDLLINPYGSAFPGDAWNEIYRYLLDGGNLLNIGGSPFSNPVFKEGASWRSDEAQSIFQRDLGITYSNPANIDNVKRYDTLPSEPLLSGLIDDFSCSKVYELGIKLSGQDESRHVDKAILHPLLYGLDCVDYKERKITAPVMAVDRVFGRFAGGRWVFANFSSDLPIRKEMLYRLAGFAAMGVSDFQVRPSFSCYYTEEHASLVLHANRFERESAGSKNLGLYLRIKKDNITIFNDNIDIINFQSPCYRVVPINIPLTPGLYTIEARLSTGDAEFSDKFSSCYATGFWCYDEALVSVTQSLKAGKDYLMRGDKISPIIGAAYTPHNNLRRLLDEPNAAEWDRDLKIMSEAGIKAVRIGILDSIAHVMPSSGAPDEGSVRALTSFLLSAAQYDMPVILSLFSSVPKACNCAVSYNDPVSLHAQKEFVAAISQRFAKFSNIIWDLIDDPVLSGISSGEDALVESGMHVQEVFTDWVREMKSIIRQNTNPKQMITIGQAGIGNIYPNPVYYSKETDFVSLHASSPDDILWKSLMSRTSGKPNLIIESVAPEKESVGHSLERRLVTAFAGGAAGIIDCFWDMRTFAGYEDMNTGLCKTDLSIKSELDMIPKFAEFIKDAKPYLSDRQPEDVCMVIPQSLMMYMPAIANEATRSCVRLMHHNCGTPMRAIGEYPLQKLDKPRLILLPSAGMLRQDAWNQLLKAVDEGATLLVTGPIENDEYGHQVERLSQFGLKAKAEPSGNEEKAIILGTEYKLSFSENKNGMPEKAVFEGLGGSIRIEHHGAGKIIFAAFPFELADNKEPAEALYKFALRQAGIQPMFNLNVSDPQVLVRPQVFKRAIFYSIISGANSDRELELVDSLIGGALTIKLPAYRAVMFVINRADGRILAQYGDGVTKDEHIINRPGIAA